MMWVVNWGPRLRRRVKVGYGEGCPLPQPTRGSAERRELPQPGPVKSPAQTHFGTFWGPRVSWFFLRICSCNQNIWVWLIFVGPVSQWGLCRASCCPHSDYPQLCEKAENHAQLFHEIPKMMTTLWKSRRVVSDNFSYYVNWPSETVILLNDWNNQPLREMADFTH